MPKILRQSLTFLASLILAYFALILTDMHFTKMRLPGIILGGHALFGIYLFPFYTVASYYLLDFFLYILTNRGEAVGHASPRPPWFSWLAPISLILPGVDFFLVLHGTTIRIGAYVIPLFCFAGIVAGHIALYHHKKGPGLRKVGIAAAGLIFGYLFLLLFIVGYFPGAPGLVGSPQLNEAKFKVEASRKERGRVEALLAEGADVNAKDRYGLTALQSASFKGDLELVQTLLDKGADVNAKAEEGETALSIASLMGHRAVVQVLLAKGADVNVKNINGGTALSAACREGHLEIVQVLLDHGADDHSKNIALKNPSKKNHRQVRELLIKAGAK